MNKKLSRRSILVERITSSLFLTILVLLGVTACSKDLVAEEPVPPYETAPQGGVDPISVFKIYRLSGDYSDNVPVNYRNVVLGKNGERTLNGGIIGAPDNRKDGKSPVHKLDDGFYYSGFWGQSPRDVYLTLKYSDYKTIDDVDKAFRPGKYGYAVIPEARVTESYSIEEREFWRIAEELFPEDKEEYGVFWGSIYTTGDVFDKTMNRLIADGLPGFELVYDETTYDPATDGK